MGTLSHSGRFRAVFAEGEDQAHLVFAMDAVLRRLGGTARRWRVDRMATVCEPGSGRLLASFAAVARYYGVSVDVCPGYRANRKGAVESRNPVCWLRQYTSGHPVRLVDRPVRVGCETPFHRLGKMGGEEASVLVLGGSFRAD